jgi:mono/diheme cytochrome c family protein
MPHLSELHGAATHLAVIAIPLFALLHFARRAGRGGATVAGAEPWALGAALVGVAAAGVTGLLVWGQAQTTLRGQHFRIGNAHFWLGIGVAVLSVLAAADWYRSRRVHGDGHRPVAVPIIAVLIVVGVVVQGYLGGRMTYDRGVGIDRGGELAQSAAGAARLDVALARGVAPATAGRAAFSAQGLGCARCHGDQAQGLRGPSLAGGREVEEFRSVHGSGLFPPQIVSDREFAAVDAWLQTLGGGGVGEGGGEAEGG